MRSLRATLFAWLLPPLLIVGVVAAGGAYVFMERRLASAYDLDLGDIARTLVPYLHAQDGEVSLGLSELAVAILKADSTDQIFYAVLGPGGDVVLGDRQLHPPSMPQGPSPYFWDGIHDGLRIRGVALPASVNGMPVTVIAAETINKRTRAYRDALVSAITPTVLLILAPVFAIAFGVRRGLAPLDHLRDEMQARSHAMLLPVATSGVPGELRPLVQELNQMLERLRKAQETQARFIANAAHQLRTPIAGVITQLELAVQGGGESGEHIAQARDGAYRLARLAQQVLSLARADPVSNPTVVEEPFDLAEVVKGRAATWLRAATSRGVELEFDLASARSRGVPLLAGELAENLVDNATRYGARVVRIRTRTEGRRAILEVEDDGPGIPASERQRIFQRFHRLDNESTEGSGLGLAIVHEIVQRHGGTIEVADGEGHRGTRFTVAMTAP
ncbi:MAG TPA: sensor histidine kinase [Usitatibacter sp.]|jgi:two-component system sensor histidine kinase TctE|nr:sensor histidine kinase [Usitatibacter sp.]